MIATKGCCPFPQVTYTGANKNDNTGCPLPTTRYLSLATALLLALPLLLVSCTRAPQQEAGVRLNFPVAGTLDSQRELTPDTALARLQQNNNALVFTPPQPLSWLPEGARLVCRSDQ